MAQDYNDFAIPEGAVFKLRKFAITGVVSFQVQEQEGNLSISFIDLSAEDSGGYEKTIKEFNETYPKLPSPCKNVDYFSEADSELANWLDVYIVDKRIAIVIFSTMEKYQNGAFVDQVCKLDK
jgi:hypothetical protein